MMPKLEVRRIAQLSVLSSLLFSCGVLPAFGQRMLDQMAVEFERPLFCGQKIWSEQEIASLLEAAISYAPHITANPRIAGTYGVVAENTRSGYYGGVYFGPIRVSDREVDYFQITIWGDLERGWELAQHRSYRAISTKEHPTWLLLADNNLRDEFEITEDQALTIIRHTRDMAEQQVRSPDGALLVPLSSAQVDQLHRFETSDHYVITAKSQPPGTHHNIFQAAVQFAVTDEGPAFLRAFPAYNVFEYLGLERSVCDSGFSE